MPGRSRWHEQKRCIAVGVYTLGALLVCLPTEAQVCVRANGGPNIGLIQYPDSVPGPVNGCGFACNQPTLFPDQREIRPAGCDPAAEECTIRAIVPLEFPGNAQNTSTPGTTPVKLTWTEQGVFAGSCGSGFAPIRTESADAWIQTRFSCADPQGANFPGLYTLRVQVCDGFTFCPQPNQTTTVDLTVPALDASLCLPPPKTWSCAERDGCAAGCLGPGGAGPGASSPAGGGPGLTPPGAGPGARLRYQAGGVGLVGHPQPGGWGAQIGRYWIHDYAERIVEDPDEFHVWLMTRWATYREFTDTDMDGVYDEVSPSDEYRTLTKTVDGWELAELDGTVHVYDSLGRWESTTDRNGNAKTATFDASGRLERVDFPDGRHETFGYDGADRLTSITEVGVDGVTSRTWTLIWSAIDLERIVRPDGTAWAFRYDDSRHPGFMTRMTLVGDDGTSERIEGAWEYDVSGNVTGTWRGTVDKNDADVVDRWTLSFDDPIEPTSTTVIDPLGTVSTYTISRDTVSDKPRIDQVSGDCPTCALGPNTQSFFDDPDHPMLPTRRVDGRGFETQMSYDAQGMRTTMVEAVGEPEERTTTWTYDATYPALMTSTERPSTTGNPLDLRVVDYVLDAAGNALDEVHEGVERSTAFSYTTERTYTAEGMVETVDEPGDGVADLVTFVYDGARGGLVQSERIDPLVGSTVYGHDAFNRRISVTDPNGVVVETSYDALDRVTELREKGAAMDGSEDLVTETRYTVFGDVFQVVLPRGNVLEYAYDLAGRVTSIERKVDDQPTSHGERTRFEYDAYGHRTLEAHERWDGSGWVEHARTAFFYSTRCHLDRVVAGDGAEQSVTEYAYDCNGNLDRAWDANHPSASQTNPATTLYSYDALDRLVEVEQPFGGAGGGMVTVGYSYDVQDHLVEVVDGEGTVTSYVYSDRDLLTQEVSEVSGTTDFTYTVDGLLETRTDARGIVQTRSYDLLDRPTGVDFPGTALDVTQTYDDPLVDFSLGRLTRIERDGHSIDYRYDRFGRLTEDGELGMAYDANGNVAEVVYPDGATAVYGFDFADRPSTLTLERPGEMDEPIVTASSYHPNGPLASLTLANGFVETRDVDPRYFPKAITVDPSAGPSVLDWTYTVDSVGNPTAITDALDSANDRTYGYQDVQYTLTQADGPWGTRAWTYDRIGNRLTESADGGAVDVHAYEANGVAGNSPTLDQITLGIGGIHGFTFDAAGNQAQVDLAGNVIDRTFDAASRMSRQERPAASIATEFRYDGRGFLRDALAINAEVGGGIFCDGFESGTIDGWGTAGSTCRGAARTEAVYASDGRLYAVRRSESPESSRILYFGARPVAQVDTLGGVERTLFLSTDHLGTPILASDAAGAVTWSGGFEPFGGDYSGAEAAGVFLRLPGQWADESWAESGDGLEQFENVHRWYLAGLGQYVRVDPARDASFESFVYAGGNPGRFTDPNGLCKIDIRFNQIGPTWYHAYIVTTSPDGSEEFFRGGPSAGGPSSGGSGVTTSGGGGSSSQSCCASSRSASSNSSNSSSPGSSPGGPGRNNGAFGPIVGTSGTYGPGTIDWVPHLPPQVTVLDNDCSCERWNKCLERNLGQVQARAIPYNPFSSNSNAFVTELAGNCGLPVPRKPPVWAPGWGTDLIP